MHARKKMNSSSDRPAVVDQTPNMSVQAAVSAVEDRKYERLPSPSKASNRQSKRSVLASADVGAKLTDATNTFNEQVSGNRADCELPNQLRSNKNKSKIPDTSSNVASSVYDDTVEENNKNMARHEIKEDITADAGLQISSSTHKDEAQVQYTSSKEARNARSSVLVSTNSDLAADRESISNLRAVTTLLSKDSSSSSFAGGPNATAGITDNPRSPSAGMLDDEDVLLALGQEATVNSMTIETGNLEDAFPDQPTAGRIISTSPDGVGVVNEDCSTAVAEGGKLNEKELHAKLERLEQEPVGANTRRRDSDDENEVDKEFKRQKKEACKQFYPLSSGESVSAGEGKDGRSLKKVAEEVEVETGMSSQSTSKGKGVAIGDEESPVLDKAVSQLCMSVGYGKAGSGEKQLNKDALTGNSNKGKKKSFPNSSSMGLARSISRFHTKEGTRGNGDSGKIVKEDSKTIVSHKDDFQVGGEKRDLADCRPTNNAELKPGGNGNDDSNTQKFTPKTDVTTTCSSFEEDDQTLTTTTDFERGLPRSSKIAEMSSVDSGKLSTWHPDFDTDDSDSENSSIFGTVTSKTKCQVTFTWTHTKAKRAFISGSFNDWATDQAMDRVDDVFEIDLSLRQGKHLYKFIVDGQWFYDITKESEYDAERNVNNVLNL